LQQPISRKSGWISLRHALAATKEEAGFTEVALSPVR
jgi:hypothetical protein